ncbi:uncharacterized protein N7482_003892 [Penicillium canariense]|uniref:Uncharacterized protein n=1 Tax=Penicillium canariense TaxID=189055 RepID=A0A9W9I7P3_9EURO|nr:uncharacterized protein N7482_003892 [Penicillium canariense]KAJ5168298.1 hypothetical protein N7482_003892 [Penicillium canariense]
MPQEIFFESDDSEFSETDLSVHGRKGRTSFRRRSISRHRRPEVRETLMVPVQQSTRVHRSASTGGRRPRDREIPAVMIVNEQAQRSDNTNSNKPRRVQQKVVEPDWDEEVVQTRRRAASGISREPSPYHRDTELAINQKLLEKSDLRQDLEIFKQQQEIERLERELEKHRERTERAEPRDNRESRALREEEEWYEDEISDRLRRLERFERKNRTEEERRNAEKAWRLKRLEDAEKEAAEREELKQKIRDEKLKEIVRQKEEEEERDKLKREILEEERRKAELAMKAAAVEEWKLEQERIKQKQKDEALKRDKEFRERLRLDLGYTEEEIEQMLTKKKKAEEKKKDEEEHHHHETTEKTTWIKVHRKHLLPETLLAYNLPWDWDERDTNYIIIKRWVTEDFQEELFAHTRRLREGKLVAQTSSSTTELRINDRNKDKMFLVRKKSPSRRLRIFA